MQFPQNIYIAQETQKKFVYLFWVIDGLTDFALIVSRS